MRTSGPNTRSKSKTQTQSQTSSSLDRRQPPRSNVAGSESAIVPRRTRKTSNKDKEARGETKTAQPPSTERTVENPVNKNI